jgi:DNA ligase (NAD+)
MNQNVTIQNLENEILENKKLYYEGRPKLSDDQYDQLENKLKNVCPNSYVLKMVGFSVSGKDKIKHETKMLSLRKTYSIDELKDWIGENEVVTTHKIDGMSCSLVYEDGSLTIGKTRGDGTYGENILEKCLWIDSIPKSIKSQNHYEIRGEIFCDDKSFYELSDLMSELKLDRPTSKRNIVAGLIGRKENLNLCKYLKFYAFEILELDNKSTSIINAYEVDKFKELEKLIFLTPPISLLSREDCELERIIKESKNFMENGQYLIDGLVFTYNDVQLHDELGETSHHPRYKMAFKFQGEVGTTKVIGIQWQLSRNRVLTPVANVETVEISGAKIQKVTLHNYGQVKLYEIKKGDTIKIVRSGEVIPKFLEKIDTDDSIKFEIPLSCPVCCSNIIEEDIRLYCSSDLCIGAKKEEILHFIRKMGIDDLSAKRLELLMNAGLVKNIVDLYKINEEDLLTLDKVKEKLANKLITNINESKKVNITTFMSSIGLTGGAFNKCEKIYNNGYKTIESWLGLGVNDILEIESFAEKSAESLYQSIQEKKVLIEQLCKIGFKFEKINLSTVSGKLSNKKFCITGTMSRKRIEIEKFIKENGGIFVNSVNKTTDFLVCNDPSSDASKVVKAKKLKINIISEKNLLDMVKSL